MKVWLSTIGQRLDYADNTRTMLLARYLLERNHEVTLWTSAYDHIRKEWRSEWIGSGGDAITMPNGLIVRFMKGNGNARNIGVQRLLDHTLAARDFTRQARDLSAPDVVVASLPDHITAAAMVDYAERVGVPAIVDVRDKWPDIFIDYAPALARPLVRLGLWRESRRTRRTLRRADALVAMMGSMLSWGLAKAGRNSEPRDKIFYLATMSSTDAASAPLEALGEAHRAILTATEGKMRFSFVGTYNLTQHPLLILDALDNLRRRPDFVADSIAVLIGGDGVHSDEVDRRIAAMPFVHKLGWLKPDEMRAILVRSDVGLLPLNFASPAFNNKAFAYLACGLPILNCALGDLATLIDDHGVGRNLTAGDAVGMADAIALMLSDPDGVSAMQKRTKALYASAFDQQRTYHAYVDHIERIVEDVRADRLVRIAG